METLWSKEQKAKKKAFKKAKVRKQVQAQSFTIVGITPQELFKKAGYKEHWGDYVKYFSKNSKNRYRFHAKIKGQTIEIHTDKIKHREDNTEYHIASTYQIKEEKQRLKDFIPGKIRVKKVETALNLKELQKFKTPPPIRKISFWDKLKVYLKQTFTV